MADNLSKKSQSESSSKDISPTSSIPNQSNVNSKSEPQKSNKPKAGKEAKKEPQKSNEPKVGNETEKDPQNGSQNTLDEKDSKQRKDSKEDNLIVGNQELGAEEEKMCRICLDRFEETDIKNNLVINPCNCQANYAFAHIKCINERLEETKHENCDVCRFKYVMEKSPKSFRDWINEKPNIEESIELLVRIINILHVSSIGCMVWYYTGVHFKSFLTLLLLLISVIRIIWVSKLCIELFIKSKIEFQEWKTKNFKIKVKQNPDYKKELPFDRRFVAQNQDFRKEEL